MIIPKELKYSQDHEWIKVKDNTAIIGVSDFAQSQLGDVVFVELPEIGMQVNTKQDFVVIESVKAVSNVYAPVSGKIIKVNDELLDEPELINNDPYGKGWIAVIEMADEGELAQLLDSTAYEKAIAKEED